MLPLLLYLTAVLHFSTCGSMDLCQGDNQCSLCTVTGPTVIDIHGQVNAVQDRCAYILMRTPLFPDFQVRATFQERRRKDVSFLDHVILSLDNPRVDINLEQGGKVQINQPPLIPREYISGVKLNSILGHISIMVALKGPVLDNVPITLNATARLVHRVELSQDQTGVTTTMSHLNNTITVFFDGYTAQLHIKGPSGQAPTVDGLCGNSSRPLTEVRLSDYSATGCETQYQDAADGTIDCNTTTERCNLLKEAPFTDCHSSIDPEPYVAACTSTLCRYPAVDGLNCQFLEAYAKACSFYSNDTLDSWRSKANCSADPQAFCQDRFCSAHEFCGETSNSGETRCHCRAIFASPYRSQNKLGNAVVCNNTARSVTLVGCLLGDRGISYTDLHLYDKSCRGDMNNETHMVTFGFDSKTAPCGTMIRMNNSEVINKNAIILTTTGDELMDFTCPFVLPDISIDFSVTIKVKSGTSGSAVAYITTGVWNYTLTMNAYTNEGRTHIVNKDTLLHLNQRVWFELKADGLNEKMVSLVTHSCFATNEPSSDSSLTYNLIMNGCANIADKTVVVESNGQGTANYFSFNMFQFSGKTREVYLHCRLNLCAKTHKSCVPSCSPNARRRRSARSKYNYENPAIIIMAWST